MIENRAGLKYYLSEDLKRFGEKPSIKDWFLKNEVWYIYKYQRHLRYVEYYKNTGKSKILFFYHFLRYKRMCFKLKIDIKPNNMAPGFRIYHLGALIRIKPNCKIGKNCSLMPGVVIGNKKLHSDYSWVNIGDNCYIGLGAKIFGEVTIGDNVVIGANSVVTKNISDNCVVAGIPAKVIKRNGKKLKTI
ncbi:serine acetyltransferase [uncultured Draconibacterium sp.]|uniref:serine O-acetyltransferase n=1 Tax=uncultured Draconibacterium sp. TaxID=1573823 RepID=UPI0029C69A4C|nr:serine acetyltransferase [uncultured Draconibacterium sp.]